MTFGDKYEGSLQKRNLKFRIHLQQQGALQYYKYYVTCIFL